MRQASFFLFFHALSGRTAAGKPPGARERSGPVFCYNSALRALERLTSSPGRARAIADLRYGPICVGSRRGAIHILQL